MTVAESAPSVEERPPSTLSPGHALLHRWLIQYNPAYLVSATLVMVGVIALSDGLAHRGGVAAQLGITAIAEIYAWALIGSAALLVRIGQRRPAVMLMLLVSLYQCDLTLHTASSAFLGWPGVAGSVVWAASFVAKLLALAWAMRLQWSRSALLLTSATGVGLAGLPWLLRALDARSASAVITLWVFGVLAAGLWTNRRVVSRAPLDAWASTVAARSARAIWIGWGGAVVLHALFWSDRVVVGASFTALVPMLALLATRFVVRERGVWWMVGGTLVCVAVVAPAQLSVTAAMAAAVVVLRALRCPTTPQPREVERAPADPYRHDVCAPPIPVAAQVVFAGTSAAERARWLCVAAALAYVALWTWGWRGGLWPVHHDGLDIVFVVLSTVAALRQRRLAALAPALTLMHRVAVAGLIPVPRSTVAWGGTAVAAGFALLAVALAGTVWWTRTHAASRRARP